MEEYKTPTACSDPAAYIRRCARRRRHRAEYIEATTSTMLRAALILLLWAVSMAALVGAV